MTIVKEVVDALHQRLKELSIDATPDKIAYLAKALESIAGQSTVLDIVNITDEKLKDLLDTATKHLNDLNTNKTNSLSAITDAKEKSLEAIDALKTNSLNTLKTSSESHISLLDTRKDTHIAAINSVGDLGAIKDVVDNLKTISDIPDGSSIMKEIKNSNMIKPGSLPFLFGILSRHNDNNWGYGHFTTELGKWYNSTSYANNMLSLIAGTHTYTTSYVSFYRPPSIYFLQGKNGTFIYKEMYLRYATSENNFKYPYALLGVIFVKNTTSSDITRTLNFVGSSGWNSQYEGAGVFVGTSNDTDKTKISAITWVNVYNYGSSSSGFSNSGSVVIPADKTVAILFYTSPYYYTNTSNYYVQFMQWGNI